MFRRFYRQFRNRRLLFRHHTLWTDCVSQVIIFFSENGFILTLPHLVCFAPQKLSKKKKEEV